MCILAGFSGTQRISISLVSQKPGQFHFFDTFEGTWNSTYVSKTGQLASMLQLIYRLIINWKIISGPTKRGCYNRFDCTHFILPVEVPV